MKISCTVEEFAKLVRGCNNASKNFHCTHCPLYELCESERFIEQFITHDGITENHEFFRKRMNLPAESDADVNASEPCEWRPETDACD